jgi:hypothetical protein
MILAHHHLRSRLGYGSLSGAVGVRRQDFLHPPDPLEDGYLHTVDLLLLAADTGQAKESTKPNDAYQFRSS